MRILLIGEFSGVHNNLKDGLIAKGHNVTLASNADGFKNLSFDIEFCPYKGNNILAALKNIINFLMNINVYLFNDVVQFINPLTVPSYFQKIGLLKLIFLCNKKTTYYACGTDIDFINSRKNFKYFPFDDVNSLEYPKYKEKHYIAHKYFLENIDMIIPAMYTYSFRRNIEKQTDPIMLPGSFVSKYKKNEEGNKLILLFGITRRNFKGADLILSALKRIEIEFKSEVDICIIEKVSLEEYYNYLNKADILIDQCKSYDYGMNAVLALERGAIVLSGAEREALEYNGMDTSAVVNIEPNADLIYLKLKELILLTKNERDVLKLESLNHCKKYHNNSDITNKFINLYK